MFIVILNLYAQKNLKVAVILRQREDGAKLTRTETFHLFSYYLKKNIT